MWSYPAGCFSTRPGPRARALPRVLLAFRRQNRDASTLFLTNAIKVTVSVLYWYEELPVQLEIFGKDLRIFFFVFVCPGMSPGQSTNGHFRKISVDERFAFINEAGRVGGVRWPGSLRHAWALRRWAAPTNPPACAAGAPPREKGYGTQGSQVITDLSTN